MSVEEEHKAPVALCMPTQVISDDENDGDAKENACEEDEVVHKRESESSNGGDEGGTSPITTMFDLDDRGGMNAPAIVEDEEDCQPTNLAAESLRHHQKFGHICFKNLQIMARLGWIPRKLTNFPAPTCSSCLHAKTTKRSWRSRSSDNKDEARKATKPGQCVSVDQLVSPTPGLVAQMIGFLTMTRCKHAAIYVDQASRLSHVCLQKTATAEENLLGKEAFELCARERGVTILACHADNGIFKAHKWAMACRGKGQSLMFAGVNAHHQNGIAERRIRILQELARTMLVHGNKRWPKAVTNNSWPCALRMANDVLIATPLMQNKEKLSPHQIFANTRTQSNPKHWKPFGCPVCVLDSSIQGGRGIIHKWKQRSKVGTHLGRSPQHARSVALVLDRQTALVSPQFHVTFDPSLPHVQARRIRFEMATQSWIRRSEGARAEEHGEGASPPGS
jgi:hypothetical protein